MRLLTIALVDLSLIKQGRHIIRWLEEGFIIRKTALASVASLVAISMPSVSATAETDRGSLEQFQPHVTPIGTDQPASSQHVSASADELTDAASDVMPLVADTIYSLGVSKSLYAPSARDTLGSSHGFAGQVVNEADRSITLYWKGGPPDHVDEYLATAASLDVSVEVVKGASHTRAEAQAAIEQLIESDLSEEAGIGWLSVNFDGSGITVHMIEDPPSEAVKSQIAKVAGLDTGSITYEPDAGEIVPLAGTRDDDVAPWKGGARTYQGNVACSTGFAALSQGIYGRLLSANHCDPDTDETVTDGGGTTIATEWGVASRPAIDSQIIDPIASPATTPKIYIGSWGSSAEYTVQGWASNWTDQTVCSGGATTGSECGKIIDDAIAVPGLYGGWYVHARDQYGNAMTGGGDSGGPVYKGLYNGVQARGTIIGGIDNEVSCGVHNPDVNPTCREGVVYVPISVVLNSFDIELETG